MKKGVILGHVDRFETGQKVLTDAPAGTAGPAGPATALASPGASRTELIRVFYVVLYPYSRNRSEFPPTATMHVVTVLKKMFATWVLQVRYVHV